MFTALLFVYLQQFILQALLVCIASIALMAYHTMEGRLLWEGLWCFPGPILRFSELILRGRQSMCDFGTFLIGLASNSPTLRLPFSCSEDDDLLFVALVVLLLFLFLYLLRSVSLTGRHSTNHLLHALYML